METIELYEAFPLNTEAENFLVSLPIEEQIRVQFMTSRDATTPPPQPPGLATALAPALPASVFIRMPVFDEDDDDDDAADDDSEEDDDIYTDYGDDNSDTLSTISDIPTLRTPVPQPGDNEVNEALRAFAAAISQLSPDQPAPIRLTRQYTYHTLVPTPIEMNHPHHTSMPFH